MTHVKVFLCDNLFNTLSLIIREEVTRLLTLISRIKPFCKSEAGPTSTTHLGSSKPASAPPSSRSSLKESLTGMLSFHHKSSLYDAGFLLTYIMQFWTPLWSRLPWNPPSPSWCWFPFLSRKKDLPGSSYLMWPCSWKTTGYFETVSSSLSF